MKVYIKEVLALSGITQRDLAERMNVTPQNISAIISRPSFPTLERIAAALGVEPWQLLAPPEVVERMRQAAARHTVRPLLAVVRVGADTYTADTLDELRDIVEKLEREEAKR